MGYYICKQQYTQSSAWSQQLFNPRGLIFRGRLWQGLISAKPASFLQPSLWQPSSAVSWLRPLLSFGTKMEKGASSAFNLALAAVF